MLDEISNCWKFELCRSTLECKGFREAANIYTTILAFA